jgi:hypothetical protein
MDYHELKSLVDCLFPITFADGTLCPADEVTDGTLICADTGPTLYRGLRGELAYYFGEEFVSELDELEHHLRTRESPRASGTQRTSLPGPFT